MFASKRTLGVYGTGVAALAFTGMLSGVSSAAPTQSSAAASAAARTTMINCGGGAVTDGLGRKWSADFGFTGGQRRTTTAAIRGTSADVDQSLYQVQREGMSGYSIPVSSAGTYRVQLNMAEIRHNAAGARVFSVTAEGASRLKDLDIFKAVGKNAKHNLAFEIPVTDGTLNLRFVATKGTAAVGSIEVSPSAAPAPAPTPAGRRPLLIEHGWDTATAGELASDAAHVNTLPFDGVAVRGQREALSRTAVPLATAQSDLAQMPSLSRVKHNFLVMRMLDPRPAGRPTAYDFTDDALWATMAANVKNYASAAKATGKFDGIMIDTEYYGSGPAIWDFGGTQAPWTASGTAGSVPGKSASQAQALVQSRGKQLMDAMRSVWPNVKVFSLYGPWFSESASYTSTRMMGSDQSWANELVGPFFMGLVQSAAGSPAVVIDGAERYMQRTVPEFQNAKNWVKEGLPNHGGRIVPAAGVSAAQYKSTVQIAQSVWDRDALAANYPGATASQLQSWVTNALKASDDYVWLYTEQYDWRRTGWPSAPVPQSHLNAVSAARAAVGG